MSSILFDNITWKLFGFAYCKTKFVEFLKLIFRNAEPTTICFTMVDDYTIIATGLSFI